MSNKPYIKQKECLEKIRAISNPYRFRILELTSVEAMNIKSISMGIGLSYTKCADYVKILEKKGLVAKARKGRETIVRSNVKLSDYMVIFSKTRQRL